MADTLEPLGIWMVMNHSIPLIYTCSKCEETSPENYPYCPYCGKKMDPDWKICKES